MLNQIILIEKTKLVSKLLTAVLSDKSINSYCLDQIENFTYLIDDLAPQIVLVEVQTASEDWQLFWDSLNKAKVKNFKLILFGEKEQVEKLENLEKFDAVLLKPLDISTIYEQLSSLVE